MKTLLTIVLFISLGLCISCDLGLGIYEPTELEKLPPLTTSGENTFGCLVNGVAFAVTNTSRMSAIYQGINQRALSLSGEIDNSEVDENVSMFIGNTIKEGEKYQLDNATTHKGKYDNQIGNCIYETSSIFQGYIYISKLDSLDYLLAGTFEFDAYSKDCQDTVRITDGRFDMQYIP